MSSPVTPTVRSPSRHRAAAQLSKRTRGGVAAHHGDAAAAADAGRHVERAAIGTEREAPVADVYTADDGARGPAGGACRGRDAAGATGKLGDGAGREVAPEDGDPAGEPHNVEVATVGAHDGIVGALDRMDARAESAGKGGADAAEWRRRPLKCAIVTAREACNERPRSVGRERNGRGILPTRAPG